MNNLTFADGRLVRKFDDFGPSAYRDFLQLKKLPEHRIEVDRLDAADWIKSTAIDDGRCEYSFSSPERFASMLGVAPPVAEIDDLPFHESLYDDQQWIVETALAAKRYACWSDCGLGKTRILLEFARQVIHRTGGRFLIFTLNDIVEQFLDECRDVYGDALPMVRLKSRDEMRAWAADNAHQPYQLAITNYEKLNPKKGEDQVVDQLRLLAGIGLDDASRLRGGGGRQKWAAIKSSKGVEYKMSCTATPAPNDWIEFASQGSFLERMRDEGDGDGPDEIIWTFFARDKRTQEWTVKRHARAAFFRFLASWSIYVRHPKRFGWRLDHAEVPPPSIHVHDIQPTAEQIEVMSRFSTNKHGQGQLPGLDTRSHGIVGRSKLSQIAKGFVYGKGDRRTERIESAKPGFVARLADDEISDGLQVLIWTVFDSESDILLEQIRQRGLNVAALTGKTRDADRASMLRNFKRGEIDILIGRARMIGYGQNLQCAGSMIFSGWDDSYEAYYQAIRRAYRDGQTRRVRVHLPVIECLEGDMLENIWGKEAKHLEAIDAMESQFIEALKDNRAV